MQELGLDYGIVVPRYHLKAPKFPLIDLKNACFIKYSNPKPSGRSTFFASSHLLVVVLKGFKTLYLPTGELRTQAPGFFFAPSGSHCAAEFGASDGVYESLLFFIHPRWIGDFWQEYAGVLGKPGLHSKPGQQKPDPAPSALARRAISQDLRGQTLATLTQVLPFFSQLGEHTIAVLNLRLKELFLMLCAEYPAARDLVRLLAAESEESLSTVMERDFLLPLSLEEFAQRCAMSLASFKREFTKTFRSSPARWILERRLEHARSLLLLPGARIGEIAYRSGFQNQSHFSKLFRQKYAETPREFMQRKDLFHGE